MKQTFGPGGTWRIGLAVLLAAFILLEGFVVYRKTGGSSTFSASDYADRIIAVCKEAGYRPSCYDKEIPKVMKTLSMEDAFRVTKLVQDKDPEFLYCHVVAHRLSFQESQKDPSKWKDVLGRCPMAMCNYGCLHGSLMQRFSSDTLTDDQITTVLPDLSDVCEPRQGFNPTEIDRTMCYHAMGHLGMYITGGTPERALKLCEAISTKQDGRTYLSTCVEGVFMTVFQSIDPEDLALVAKIKPTKEQLPEFCATYGDYWHYCRRESYPYFRDEIQKPEGLLSFCSYAVDNAMEDNCYSAAINIFATNAFAKQNPVDGVGDLTRYCAGLPKNRLGTCFADAAMRLLQNDPFRYLEAVAAICRAAADRGVGDACYKSLLYYSSFSFHKGSQEELRYCAALPEDWKRICLTKRQEVNPNGTK